MIQIGVDLGGSQCKVIGLKHSWLSIQPVGVAEVPIPPGAVSSHGLTQLPELSQAVGRALKEARPHRLHTRNVVSAIPASFVLTKLLEFPLMPRTELAEAIHFEASQAFPVPIEELSIDWITLPRNPKPTTLPSQPSANQPSEAKATTAPPAATIDVFVMGAPRGLVENYVDFFRNLHLNLIALEIKPLANARAILGPSDLGPLLLVDIGAHDTSLVVMAGGELRHLSSLEFGAQSLNPPPPGPAPLAENSSNIKSSASRPKRREKETINISRSNSKNPVPDLAVKLKPLVDEIDHVVKFYEHRGPSFQTIKYVRLCGGGALLPGLAATLHHLTNLETSLADPRLHLKSPITFPGEASLPFTTAIGLALHP